MEKMPECIFYGNKKVCGDIELGWFMSDDAEQYYNGWKGVFTVAKHESYFVLDMCIVHEERHYMNT